MNHPGQDMCRLNSLHSALYIICFTSCILPFEQVNIKFTETVAEIEPCHLRVPSSPFILSKYQGFGMNKVPACPEHIIHIKRKSSLVLSNPEFFPYTYINPIIGVNISLGA